MPILTVLAGPNGAGKTRSTDYLLDNNYISIRPLDLDLLKNESIDSFSFDQFVNAQKINKKLEYLLGLYCTEAIQNKKDFSYECNFRLDQLKHIAPFHKANYEINLIYMILHTIEQSIVRVDNRQKEGGTKVDIESINVNFYQGLKNLDNGFNDFDKVIIIDNSIDFKNGRILFIKHPDNTFINPNFPPEPLVKYLPKITKFCMIYRSYMESLKGIDDL